MHWTEKMFIEHGDLWIKISNRGPDNLAHSKEIEALERIFSETGVKAGGRVLDLGCSSGGHALNLAKKGFSVTGVDFSPIAVKRAEELAEKWV
jgi:cyclopropane fatty-acyl-phospholipid synthase-like methyltransferase